MSFKVLVVDDEDHIVELARIYLTREGYEVEGVGDGSQALARFAQIKPDLVVLDIMLPGADGLAICKEIRKQSQVPIIMLTARDEVTDKVVGLEVGADDYLTKPFSPRELVARVAAVLRRTSPPGATAGTIELGDLLIDAGRREARKRGSPLRLTTLEFDLLWFLASNPDRVFARDDLMERVWGYTSVVDTGTVTVHVRRLREKIEDDSSQPRHLETVWGSGYRWTP
jgi:DNA-binding response OmpR family regulator